MAKAAWTIESASDVLVRELRAAAQMARTLARAETHGVEAELDGMVEFVIDQWKLKGGA